MNSERQSGKTNETGHESRTHKLQPYITKSNVSVKLVRLEDDEQLASLIRQHNLKTDLDYNNPVFSANSKKCANINELHMSESKINERGSEEMKTAISVNVNNKCLVSQKTAKSKFMKRNLRRNNINNVHEEKQKRIISRCGKIGKSKRLSGAKTYSISKNKTFNKNLKKTVVKQLSHLGKSSVNKNNIGKGKKVAVKLEGKRKVNVDIITENQSSNVINMPIKERNGCITPTSNIKFNCKGDDTFLNVPVVKSEDVQCSVDVCGSPNRVNASPKQICIEDNVSLLSLDSTCVRSELVSSSYSSDEDTARSSGRKRKLLSQSISRCKIIKSKLKDPCSTKNCSRNENIISELEEPLSLISQLTGCNIAPSEVKLLSLPSDNVVFPEESQSKVVDTKLGKEQSENELCTVHNDGGTCVNTNQLVKNGSQLKKNSDRSESAIRTIFDLMKAVSILMPSWNLHILPDTDSFCIGQVTRNREGIPHLSKCIILDDYFNAKVYIYQQHCAKFDGVYDNEDTLYVLINEVDRYH